MRGKIGIIRSFFAVGLILTALTVSLGAHVPVLAQTTAPGSVMNNFGTDPETGRNFSWFTSADTKEGYVEYCIRKQFGGFDNAWVRKVKAQSRTIKTDTDTRTVYKVSLKGLLPGTEYVYRAGTPGNYSAQGSFKTAGKDPGTFTFLNMTDTQGGSAKDYSKWKDTLDKALGKFPDARFLVHTGDLVDTGYLIRQWDMFGKAAEGELLNLPILPAVGNHDALNANRTNGDDSNFTDRFNLPDAGDTGAPAGTVYSVDYGDLHIAVMNTQCGNSNYKKQAEWLRKDMNASDRLWKVVALHRGPYGATYDTTDIRSAWAPVFDELGVDLVLQGHDHNYVRSWPIKGGHRAEAGKGTIYVVANSGGVKYYPLMSRSWQAVDLQPKLPMYIAVTVSKHQLKIEAYDVKGALLDKVTLSQ